MTTTAIMSTATPPAISPSSGDAAASPPNLSQPALSPPQTTSSRQNTLSSPLSHASKSRLSQYSVGEIPSRSRPPSHTFPMFPSSLPYTQVRDFAYPVVHPMHYGPLPDPPSGFTTPASETRRLSDPPASWEQRMPWDSWTADGFNRGHDLPPIQFGDGPPYSEDEDLQSPVVSTRHRKNKSTSTSLGSGKGRPAQDGAGKVDPSNFDDERGYFAGTAGDGSERYYVSQGGEANGPGGEFVTYPSDQARHNHPYQFAQQSGRNDLDGYRSGSDHSSNPSSPAFQGDQSRYSRDYQFTITSPDEEFHGKAVALFDFERENENELPLVEGQIIWVSYRHGQGWLVAEDPKTQESGLVPEAYVRLLRDIEGGMNSLTGQSGDGTASPNEVGTPTQAEPSGQEGHILTHNTSSANGYHQPIVSMFSTSSKDLNPYPTEQLGIHAGQAPPQVIHYHGQRGGSQISTPTFSQLQESGSFKRDSQDSVNKEEASTPTAESSSKLPESQSMVEAMDTDR